MNNELRALAAFLGAAILTVVPLATQAATPPDVWRFDKDGAAVCQFAENDMASAKFSINMHGQAIHMVISHDPWRSADWNMRLGWPIWKNGFDKVNFLRGGQIPIDRTRSPQIAVNGSVLLPGKPIGYRYDGVFDIQYRATNGMQLSCDVFPSVTRRAAIEAWTIENIQKEPVTIEIASERTTLQETTNAMREPSLIERAVLGIEKRQLAPGKKAAWAIMHTFRTTSEPPLAVNVAKEQAARQALFREARERMVLQTPEPVLDGTFRLAKFRLLEAPVESSKGLIQGTGTMGYMGGTWANDNCEYGAPACPYLGDATLDESCNNMFRLWLNREKQLGIPASFESYNLITIGGGRGDMAMIMLGLSRYLLAKGDTNLASEFWPLLLKVAENTKTATLTNGVVGSGSDELEGRYPNGGKANLSTSSLSYAGYRAAARLARALGKVEEAQDYGTRADDLGKAIESHFGAEVEGFSTYRYYEGCVCLRGWISLPVFAGIMNRKQGTVDALFSTNLWTENQFSTGIKAASTDKSSSGWPRETYYALIAAFKAGYTSQALEKTITAVRHGMLSNHGPYLSEDGGNLLSPNVLYLRVITDGLFGIEPQSLESFSCTPRLPSNWPAMRLSNIFIAGRPVDLAVERSGTNLKLTVSQSGHTLYSQTGPEGTVFEVDLSQARRLPAPDSRK